MTESRKGELAGSPKLDAEKMSQVTWAVCRTSSLSPAATLLDSELCLALTFLKNVNLLLSYCHAPSKLKFLEKEHV